MKIPVNASNYQYCKNCNSTDFGFLHKGAQLGIYCSRCGRWLKWADKDEQNLYELNNPVQSTVHAISLPDNATNGDVIKAVFPNIKIYEQGYRVNDVYGMGTVDEDDCFSFDLDWWNSPYKKEVEE